MQVNCSDYLVFVVPEKFREVVEKYFGIALGLEFVWEKIGVDDFVVGVSEKLRVTPWVELRVIEPLIVFLISNDVPHVVGAEREVDDDPRSVPVYSVNNMENETLRRIVVELGGKPEENDNAYDLARKIIWYAR